METDVLIEHKVKQKTEATKTLILYNDDNTFQWVIECLMKYCRQDSIQAEQIAHLVHFKGRCQIMNGDYDKLKPIHDALLENGLTSKIE